MFSLLTTGKQLYGDALIDIIAHLLYPANSATHGGGGGYTLRVGLRSSVAAYLNAEGQLDGTGVLASWAAWLSLVSGMALALALLVFAFLLLLLSVMHIPLPSEICDQKKIQVVEFALRVANEHFGNFVELLVGPTARNRLTRFLCSIPFYFQKGPPKWCSVVVEKVAGVPCRIYLPQGSRRKTNATVVFIHGGGWCIMKPNFYDGPIYSLLSRFGGPIVSIDYTLSPEAKFPTAILECERVLEALQTKKVAHRLTIDPKRLALMGDSAGGNLCAVLCQRALRSGRPPVKCQVLLYPVIHALDFKSPGYTKYYTEYKGAALLNPRMLVRWLLMYLGEDPSDKNIRMVLRNEHITKAIRESPEFSRILDHSLLPQSMVQGAGGGDECTISSISSGINGGIFSKDFQPQQPQPHQQQNGYQLHTPSPPLPPLTKDSPLDLNNNTHTTDDQNPLAAKLTALLTNPDVCPILGTQLNGLPPALVCTAGIDILRDEGILYMRRLKSFGVPVQWNHYDAAFHGILHMPMSKQRKQILDDLGAYLHERLVKVAPHHHNHH